MFKVGDIVKLKPHSVIEFKGFSSPSSAEEFIRFNETYTVSHVVSDGRIGLSNKNNLISNIYPYYFNADNFILYESVHELNEKKPYKEITKLEYAAIQIFQSSHWDMSDEYRRNVITAAKKLLEECND